MQCKRLAVTNQLFSDEPSRLRSVPIWESMCRSTRDSLNMALGGKLKTLQKSPGKSRGIAWKDKDVEELIELMKVETIMCSLENAKTSKEKRAVYNSVQLQQQNKGNVKLVANIAHWN